MEYVKCKGASRHYLTLEILVLVTIYTCSRLQWYIPPKSDLADGWPWKTNLKIFISFLNETVWFELESRESTGLAQQALWNWRLWHQWLAIFDSKVQIVCKGKEKAAGPFEGISHWMGSGRNGFCIFIAEGSLESGSYCTKLERYMKFIFGNRALVGIFIWLCVERITRTYILQMMVADSDM
jgi:hypothetical protein